jgi:hypothetical protein
MLQLLQFISTTARNAFTVNSLHFKLTSLVYFKMIRLILPRI